jgi:hypothetical protein
MQISRRRDKKKKGCDCAFRGVVARKVAAAVPQTFNGAKSRIE